MNQEYNFRQRGDVCSLCMQPLEDKRPCVSVLRETEEGFERLDCHPACWKETPRDWQPFSFWEAIYERPLPMEPKQEAIKKETAETLLRRLVILEDPAMQNVVYVLAVMLERGKQLIERDAKPQQGGILRVYEHKKTGDTFVIFDPRLRLDQLGMVQQQVVALLSGTQALNAEGAEVVATPVAPTV